MERRLWSQPRRSHLPTPSVLMLVCVMVASAPTEPAAEINGRSFCADDWPICLDGPKNWQLTEQTAYPNVLLSMVRREPRSKMLLTAEKQNLANDSLEYANNTIKILRDLGFNVRKPQFHSATGAYWVDFDNGRMYLRQAFIVVDELAYALTLAAPSMRTRGQQLRAFDYGLRSIRIQRTAAPRANSAPEKHSDPD